MLNPGITKKSNGILLVPCNNTILLTVILCGVLSAAGGIEQQDQVDFSPDTIIVKFKEGVSADALVNSSGLGLESLDGKYSGGRAIQIEPLFRNFKQNQRRIDVLLNNSGSGLNRADKHLRRRLLRAQQNVAANDLSRIYRIKIGLDTGQSLQDIIRAYQKSPYVEYAEPDYYVRLCQIPNDPNYPRQWALSKIDAPKAWDIHTGSHDVIVAVIDTGIDLTHPDFQGNIWTNEPELNGLEGVDDDGNGYVDDVHGYDFAYDDGEPLDDYSHGSHVAGIIAARGNNGTDVCGICWNATIMPLKGKDPDTLGPVSKISEAVYYAVINGADILSCSWGMNPPSEVLAESFQYAYQQGVVAVAAAGNDNSSSVFYPAGYSTVISVGASTQNDQRASFSNYGSWVDLMAPGVNILSLSYYGMTMTAQGTSMACPHVSGACALMLSVNPNLTPDEVRRIVTDNGDTISSGMCLSNRRVNLFNALRSAISSKGAVHFDEDFYSCASTVSIIVVDADLKETATCPVVLTSDSNDCETVILTEKAPAIGVFGGSITANESTPAAEDGILQVQDGDCITVSYLDEHGIGRDINKAATYTDTAVIDGQAPVISFIEIDASSSQPAVIIETDEPTIATILYREADSPEASFITRSTSVCAASHTVVLDELCPQTNYTFVIEAVDDVGNITRDDNSGMLYEFTTIPDAGNLYVPADYATIQGAIDHCWDGDTVWVADGTYTGTGNRDIDFEGKAITVRSENGPEACVIDCQGSEGDLHRAFYFHNRETADSVLDGFTITGGFQEGDYTNGTICLGGGILCNASSPTIKNCVFRSNTATYGGGLHNLNGGKITLTNCVFVENSAQRGAGVSNDESTLEAVDCLFSRNVAASYYGGLFSGWENSRVTLTRCIFTENVAGYGAGGLGVSGPSSIITNCEFIGNTSIGDDWSRGAAIQTSRSNISIQNCLFSGNRGNSYGAIYQYQGQIDLMNCTFAGNTASDGKVAAVFAYEDDSAILRAKNCIFWDGGLELFADEWAQFDICYSDIQGSYPGEGNINQDPLFVDAGYWDDLGTPTDPNDDIWTNGDYHLRSRAGYWDEVSQSHLITQADSPCIDAGDPNSPIGQEPSPNGERINMGTYGGTDQASLSSN